MFYSKSTNGFYDIEIHGDNIPNDAVEITQEHYTELLTGQSDGQQIVADEDGLPTLTERPVIELNYAQKRIKEYPPIGDQLDALWKGGEAAAEMLALVQAVKTKYPKDGV